MVAPSALHQIGSILRIGFVAYCLSIRAAGGQTIHVENGKWIGIAFEAQPSVVELCSLQLKACEPMQKIGEGFFATNNAKMSYDRGVYIVSYEAGGERKTKLFDLRDVGDTGRGYYVILGAAIGFLSTVLTRFLESGIGFFRNRRLQIDQLRSNVLSVEATLPTGAASGQTEIVSGLTPFGVAFLHEEIRKIRVLLTEHSLQSKTLDQTVAGLKTIYFELGRKRIWAF